MDGSVTGRNVLPQDEDDPALDAIWDQLDPAETDRVAADIEAAFQEVESEREAVGRMNAGLAADEAEDEPDPTLDPDVDSDEGTADELVEAGNDSVGEEAFLPEDPTVTDDDTPDAAGTGAAAPGDVV
jgi:hypothetical protein